MKIIILALCTLFPLLAFSGSAPEMALKAQDFKNLSFNKAQSVRRAYITFLKRVERKQTYPKFRGEKFSSYPYFEKYWKEMEKFYSAYAADGDICFFGGWPSKLKDNFCEGPWHHAQSDEATSLGGGYDTSSSCGAPQYFRCNPALFGSPVPGVQEKESGVSINLSPKNGNSKGYCVDAKGSYVELTKKCELASKKSIEKQMEEIQDVGPVGDAKRKQLEDFHNSIFGEDGKSGFCGSFRSVKGEVYDACDDLKSRLSSLGLPYDKVNQAGVVDAPDEVVEVNPIMGAFVPVKLTENNLGEGMGIMQECQKFLKENSSDDIRGRRIIQNLYGGLASCNQGMNALPGEVLTESGLEKVDKAFDKMGYLNDLNIKNFKSIVSALMVSEISFMNQDGDFPKEKLLIDNKEAFKLQIKEKFPRINEEEFSKAFDEIYNQISALKNEIPKNTYESTLGTFEALADNNKDSVNKTCGAIHEEYEKKFGDKKRIYGLDWTRTISKEEKDFITEKRNILRTKVDEVYTSSKMGFLLATDHFKKHVMDPSVDFVQTCLDEREHMVIKPNIQKTNFQAALMDARKHLLDSLGDISEGRIGPTEMLSISTADGAIEDYLKTDRKLVLETILNAKGDKQKELAKFLCYRTMDIYDSDETLQFVGIMGGGLLSLAGAIGCAIPTGVTQLVGCPAIKVGAGIAVASAGVKGGQAYIEEKKLDNSITKGNTTGASDYTDDKKRIKRQQNRAGLELVLSSVPLMNTAKVATGTSTVSSGKGVVLASETGKGVTIVSQAGDDVVKSQVPVTASGVSVTDQALLIEGTSQKLLEVSKPVKTALLPNKTTGTSLIPYKEPGTALVPYHSPGTSMVPYKVPGTSIVPVKGNSVIPYKQPGTYLSNTTGTQLGPELVRTGTLLDRGRGLSTNVLSGTTRKGVTIEGEYTVVGIKKMVSLQNPRQILTGLVPVVNQVVGNKESTKDSAISTKDRNNFKRFRKIKTLPSEKLGDQFIQVILSADSESTKNKLRAQELLKELIGLDKDAKDSEIISKIKAYQLQLDPSPYASGSKTYQVSEDEKKRLDVLIKLAFGK
ncbi:MAG: hypothetical protein ACJAS4_000537 [Bacteriovoracaceae bacterium]|jgi:hypothetical protein